MPAVDGSAVLLPPVDLEAPAAELVDQLTARENAKDAIAAEQAKLMVALDQRMRAERAAKGIPAARQVKGSPSRSGWRAGSPRSQGGLPLGRAQALVNQMPHTLKALETGRLNERRAAILITN